MFASTYMVVPCASTRAAAKKATLSTRYTICRFAILDMAKTASNKRATVAASSVGLTTQGHKHAPAFVIGLPKSYPAPPRLICR